MYEIKNRKRENVTGQSLSTKKLVKEEHLLLFVQGFNMLPSNTVLLMQRRY